MPSKIYCKNGYVLASELPSGGAIDAQSGLTLFGKDRADRVSTSKNAHELRVDAVGPDVAGIKVGDHVLVYLGGDDGAVNANGISAFVKVDAVERAVVHRRYVWAVVRDGNVYPLGRIVLTKRNDAAFHRHTLGAGSLLHLPEAQQKHGQRATGPDDETNNVLASVTALYETVSRVGADVRPDQLQPGQTVCFSPSFSSTLLRVGRDWYHLVDSDECLFVVE